MSVRWAVVKKPALLEVPVALGFGLGAGSALGAILAFATSTVEFNRD